MFTLSDLKRGKVKGIGDVHASHNNIVKYCQRPGFSADGSHNFETHNKLIHKNWLENVDPSDIVINFGDTAMRATGFYTWCANLPGKITMIRGNHDSKEIVQACQESGWKVLPAIKILFDEGEVLLTHYPQYRLRPNQINLYAHTHNSPTPDLDASGRHKCMSVERIDYKPIDLYEAIQSLSFSDKAWPIHRTDPSGAKGQNPQYHIVDLRTIMPE